MTTLAERFVASVSPLPAAVQLDLAQDQVLSASLCQNNGLSPEAWALLWSARRPADEAAALVSRQLSTEQRATVLKTERRVRVIEAMLLANQITDDDVRLLNLTKLTPKISEKLFEDFHESKDIMSLVGPHLSPAWRLYWLATASEADVADDLVVELLRTIDDWWGKDRSYRLRRDALTTLFLSRPQLVTTMAQGSSADCIKTVLAGSQALRSPGAQRALLGSPINVSRYVLLAYVSNPRAAQELLDELSAHSDYEVTKAINFRRIRERGTITENYEEVSDPAILEWLVRRASPFQGQEFSSRGRLGDILSLAHNANVSLQQATQLAEGLREFYWDSPLVDKIREAASALLTLYPDLTDKLGDLLKERTAYTPYQETYADNRPQNMDSFIEHSRPTDIVSGYSRYLAGPVTDILGDAAHQWRIFLELLTEHPADSNIRDLAQTAKRLTA